MKELIRTVELSPYVSGNPSFKLEIFDINKRFDESHTLRAYRFTQSDKDEPLFEGEDYRCSQFHPIDGDQYALELLGFLTLRFGDTDSEYFDNYTEAQHEFIQQHAESVSFEAYCLLDPTYEEEE